MTILGKVLHSMTSVLQIPVVIILILFIAAILVAIGWIISEYMNEHKHMQVQLPKLLDEIRAGEQPIEEIIETSGLLKTQKEALIEITKHSDFNDLMLESLAANLLERTGKIRRKAETHRPFIKAWANVRTSWHIDTFRPRNNSAGTGRHHDFVTVAYDSL